MKSHLRLISLCMLLIIGMPSHAIATMAQPTIMAPTKKQEKTPKKRKKSRKKLSEYLSAFTDALETSLEQPITWVGIFVAIMIAAAIRDFKQAKQQRNPNQNPRDDSPTNPNNQPSNNHSSSTTPISSAPTTPAMTPKKHESGASSQSSHEKIDDAPAPSERKMVTATAPTEDPKTIRDTDSNSGTASPLPGTSRDEEADQKNNAPSSYSPSGQPWGTNGKAVVNGNTSFGTNGGAANTPAALKGKSPSVHDPVHLRTISMNDARASVRKSIQSTSTNLSENYRASLLTAIDLIATHPAAHTTMDPRLKTIRETLRSLETEISKATEDEMQSSIAPLSTQQPATSGIGASQTPPDRINTLFQLLEPLFGQNQIRPITGTRQISNTFERAIHTLPELIRLIHEVNEIAENIGAITDGLPALINQAYGRTGDELPPEERTVLNIYLNLIQKGFHQNYNLWLNELPSEQRIRVEDWNTKAITPENETTFGDIFGGLKELYHNLNAKGLIILGQSAKVQNIREEMKNGTYPRHQQILTLLQTQPSH